MKKLLLVLTVVAMASFLLVGCFGTTPVTVTGVTLDQPALALTVGGATGTLVATVAPTDATDKTVTWSSSDEAVATVAAGVVTPVAEGTADITVTTVDGGLTATCEVTVAAAVVPVTPVAPTITAILDQEVFWDEDGWTYPVVATLGTGTTLTYSLIGAPPVSMSISSTGLITWTTILDLLAIHEVTVKVVDNDGLSAEETFVIEVKEPIPPVVVPLTATIVYEDDHFYDNGTTKFVRGGSDCVGVTVTLSEAVEEDDEVQIRWNDGETEGDWIPLIGNTANLVFTGDLCFDDDEISECELVCVEVQLVTPDLFCPSCVGTTTLIHTEEVKVDSEAPILDLNITFINCDECDPGAYFTFEPNTTEPECDPEEPCCDDECSGIAGWTIEDAAAACPGCLPLSDTNCVAGTYECGCLLYADGYDDHNGDSVPDETITYTLGFTFTDNVGNAIVDTWEITLDTDSVVSFVNNQDGESNEDAVFTVGTQTVNIPYTTCVVAE